MLARGETWLPQTVSYRVDMKTGEPMAARHKSRPFAVTAALLAAGLTLTGCGLLGGEGDPPASPPTDEGPTGPNGEDTPEPEGFGEDLPRFSPGDVIDGSASEEPWQGVLVVEEQTFVALDARHEGSDGGRTIDVEDAHGEVLLSSDRGGYGSELGAREGDPGVMLDLEAGEYLVSLPVMVHPTRDFEAEDFTLQAYVPPVIEVGDTVDVTIRPYSELGVGLDDGQMFGIRLPEDGIYTFETFSDELAAYISMYSSPDQSRASDFINNDTRGFLQDEFPAGSYTVVVYNADAESGAVTLEVSGG